jgi:hypothetical protein
LTRTYFSHAKPPPQTSPILQGAPTPLGTPAEMRKCSVNIFIWFSSVYGNCLQRCHISQRRKIGELTEKYHFKNSFLSISIKNSRKILSISPAKHYERLAPQRPLKTF